MLSHNQAMQQQKSASRMEWTDDEWDLIGAELFRQYPDRCTTHYNNLSFSVLEVEEAMEAVLPQGRHHSITAFTMKALIFNALKRIGVKQEKGITSAKPAPVTKPKISSQISWKPDEWELLVLELHRLSPTSFGKRLADVGPALIRKVIDVLPFERRRLIYESARFTVPALRVWDDLPAEVKNPALQERAIVDFQSGPIMAPPKVKEDAKSSMATALHRAFETPEKVAKKVPPIVQKQRIAKKTKVFWKDHELVQVAREMVDRRPGMDYFNDTFDTVDLPFLRSVQQIFPVERQKLIVSNISMKFVLIRAFELLRKQLDDEAEAVKKAQEQNNAILLEIAKQADVQRPPFSIFQTNQSAHFEPTKPIVEAEQAPIQVQASDFMARVQTAAQPLMSVLVGELAKHLAPEIAKLLMPEFTKAVTSAIDAALAKSEPAPAYYVRPPYWPDQQSEAHSLYSAPQAERYPQHFDAPQPTIVNAPKEPVLKTDMAGEIEDAIQRATAARPKRHKIVVLGPAGKQKQELERGFLEFEFVFIEHGKGIKQAAQDCVLFLVFNNHLTTPVKAHLKEYVPRDKVKYLDGGLSAMKREINVWKALHND